jgi:hypothetical protein
VPRVGLVASVRRRWPRPSVLRASFISPRRPGRVDRAISAPGVLSLSRVVVSASPPLLRRARARASPCLRPSSSVQRSASLSSPPSSSWLRLPSLGEPALPAPTRAYLAGVPPWPPASWPGLCSPPFLLILVPKASLGLAVARPRSLLSCLRPETPAVGRAPPPCRHSRGRGT